MTRPIWIDGVALFSLLFLVGCGSGEQGPRPIELINAERDSLPALYLTDEGREVIAPSTLAGVVVDDGELAWRAWQCENPACSGQPKGDRPFVFTWPDPRANVQPDGIVGYQASNENEDAMDARVRLGGTREPTCPACLAQRDPKTESLAEAAKYREWCREYVLPATQKRLTELEAEHKARIKHVAEREKK